MAAGLRAELEALEAELSKPLLEDGEESLPPLSEMVSHALQDVQFVQRCGCAPVVPLDTTIAE